MNDLDQALADIVGLFDALSIEYAVMGGIAVRVYGIPRATYDVDFTAAISRARLTEVLGRVTALGYTVPEVYASGWVDHVAGMPIVKFRLFLEGNGVDIDIFLAESPYQKTLLARRRQAQFDELQVSLVSPEDLVLLKLLANRPRDLADVADVLFVQGKLDVAYVTTMGRSNWRGRTTRSGVSRALSRVRRSCGKSV